MRVDIEAPAFELPDLDGVRKSLAQYRGQPLLLIFLNPACGFCRDLLPKLASCFPVSQERLHLLLISTGGAEVNRNLIDEHQLTCPVLLQKETEAAVAYQANGTPAGYLIDAEGKIASELAIGAEALLGLASGKSKIRNPKSEMDESLLASAAIRNGNGREQRFSSRSLARSKLQRNGLKAGAVAPDFRLPRLDGGGELALSELRGRQVLLVFSSPACGPCNTLAPELEKFHRAHPEVEVVMISKGEPKENRTKIKEHGLTFPVVLQQQWEISRLYAMFATPIAYLIEEAGNIASDVAVGTEAILALMASTIALMELMKTNASLTYPWLTSRQPANHQKAKELYGQEVR